MSWEDRIQEAAYTSAQSETRTVFAYEDVSRLFDKKTSAFDVVGASGTQVQDNGVTGERYPLRIFFSGDNHDLQADAFLLSLKEVGIGTLEHPRYGTQRVVPFGAITQNDSLKTAANQSVIEVEFYAAIEDIYSALNSDPASLTVVALSDYNASSAAQFENQVDLDTAIERVSLRNKITSLTTTIRNAIAPVADTLDLTQREYSAIEQSITLGLDALIGDPLTLAFQTSLLIQAPARSLSLIQDKLDAYQNLFNGIVGGDIAGQANDSRNANSFFTDDLVATGAITGQCVAALNGEFSTREQTQSAALQLLDNLVALSNWQAENYDSLEITDTGEGYQALQALIINTVAYLLQQAFTLRQTRRIILHRDRTMLDFCAQYYGAIDDDTLNFFIATNDLGGDRYLELAKGDEIVYYA